MLAPAPINGGITSAEYVESSSSAGGPQNPKSITIAIGANGRGTLTLATTTSTAQNFVLYVVSSAKFFLLSADPASGTTGTNDLLFGQALEPSTKTSPPP